jgi:hypothetical protein
MAKRSIFIMSMGLKATLRCGKQTLHTGTGMSWRRNLSKGRSTDCQTLKPKRRGPPEVQKCKNQNPLVGRRGIGVKKGVSRLIQTDIHRIKEIGQLLARKRLRSRRRKELANDARRRLTFRATRRQRQLTAPIVEERQAFQAGAIGDGGGDSS